MFKDPLVRRFISSSVFAGAFIWVAVRFFNVETEVVWVLFWVSLIFVGAMMVVGPVVAPAIRLFRRDPPLLAKIKEEERQGQNED